MKTLSVLICLCVLAGCREKGWISDSRDPQNVIVEESIRYELKKPYGPITKADLKKVKSLHLGSGRLTEIPKGLEKLTQLKKLWLGDNSLTDVKGIEKLTQLTHLNLFNNYLTDIKGLEKLDQLTELELNFNKLTDVKGLEKLTELTSLNLRVNFDLTKAQIDELQKALPKCTIHHNAKK